MKTDRGALPALARSEGALHDRLAAALEKAVRSGALKPGDRLPAHRELARHYGVGIGTVTRAIDALTRRKVVRGEVGRGTYVEDVGGAAEAPIDLSVNVPLPVVPAGVLASAASRAARLVATLPQLAHGDVTGHGAHREILASWLDRGRFSAKSDGVCVTVGIRHALDLAFREICSPGDVILTEGVTFAGAVAIARSAGLRLEGVPTDDQGMLPDALDERLISTSAKAVYTTPVCHDPLTFETGEARRAALLEICLRRGAFIVEDDAYAGYGTPGIATYKSMSPDHVYYCGGLSKTLTQLVRVGVLAPPKSRMAAISYLMGASLLGTETISTAVACELIDSGADKAAIQVLRKEAALRIETVRGVLGDRVVSGTIGTHVWLPMEDDAADLFVARALDAGIRLPLPALHRPAPHHGSGVRLSVMTLHSRSGFERAIKKLARLAPFEA